jgi:hypothetical protein
MLDMIHDGFRNSKAICNLNSSIGFGFVLAKTVRMLGGCPTTPNRFFWKCNNRKASGNGTRKLVPIEPAEISKSYRRICNRDFYDVVDRYHTLKQRRRDRGTDQYNIMVRTNDTLDASDDEQKLLSMNLPSMRSYHRAICQQPRP